LRKLLKLGIEICKGGGEKELDGIEDATMGNDDQNAEAHDTSFFFFLDSVFLFHNK